MYYYKRIMILDFALDYLYDKSPVSFKRTLFDIK